MQQEATKWTIKDAFLVVLTIVCLILALDIGLILIDAKTLFSKSSDKSLITFGLFVIQEAIFILPLYFLVLRKYKIKFFDLGFCNIGIWKTIKWILKAYGIIILFNILFVAFTSFTRTEIPGFSEQASHIPLFGSSWFDIAIAVFVMLFIAPFVEEILFRGFLLKSFLGRFSQKTAVLASAAIFSIVHFEFQSIGIIFFLALVLNWIFLKSRSIWPCIGFHILNNILAFLAEWLVWTGYLQV